ncbi:MAG: Na/Pi cotransporter family protein [Clostridia bacterium]|nr:Na/Pi cotransporter family protein [Clostridia bacterium]
MSVFDLLDLLLGVALFLFGMHCMGEALRESAGNRLHYVLETLTSKSWRGFLFGAAVTAVIQSSSATTVMVVGFVNSGVMSLSQAVGVIIGANVGTSVTSWITALSGIRGGESVGSLMSWFKPSAFTPILAVLGIVFYMFSRRGKRRNLGLILLGFSVLMVGMDTMSEAVSVLEDHEGFRSVLLWFENPILGVLAGMILTAIVQSSSASIGILQSFAATGAIRFANAVPIIMGQNIGTCVTALLASAPAGINAKRASWIHLSFNVIGTVLGLTAFLIIRALGLFSFWEEPIDMWDIAATHTVFNLATALILFPFCSSLERLACLVIRDRKQGDTDRNSSK